MAMHVVELVGCTPEPLMCYLKALGVLRLVCEQADRNVLGFWKHDVFVLESCLDKQQLLSFFLVDYCPSPILGPWAGGSGFFGNDNRTAVRAIQESVAGRVEAYRRAIEQALRILADEGAHEKPSETIKAKLLRRYRREMPDKFVRWMDAIMALQEEGQSYAPLLGTGGNDGRLDFTQNFMQRVVDLQLHESSIRTTAVPLLRASLFGELADGLGKAAVGQFAPGRAGGPNATQGMEAGSTDNPWDFLLGLEGVLMLAGAAVRRLGVDSANRASFPFTVRSRAVGEGASSDGEVSEARGELWLPIWSRAATALETELLFAEGRADLSGRPARDSVEFSRAVAGLGTDRGIQSFSRYGLLKRSGKAFLAVALDRFQVPTERREAADLLFQFDSWLSEFRRKSSGREAPQRLKAALRRIESQIFEFCRYGGKSELLNVLIALGAAERELALTGGQKGGQQICRPLQGLSAAWLEATNDGSAEFEIALALAGIHARWESDARQQMPPIRANLEPVQLKGNVWAWGESGRSVVWKAADLGENLTAVIERRLLDALDNGASLAAIDFRHGVRLQSVAQFLRRETNDRRIEELLWGLTMIKSKRPADFDFERVEVTFPLPRAFAFLKPLFLPRPIRLSVRGRWSYSDGGTDTLEIRREPRILPLLRAGRISEALRVASRRLLVSGLVPLSGPTAALVSRDMERDFVSGLDPIRLAGSLLLPLRSDELDRLLRLVTRPPAEALIFETRGVE